MAFAPHLEIGYKRILGAFIERESGNTFEFSAAKPSELVGNAESPYPFPGYEVKVWVGPDANFRWADVKKTVAYIVVDEDAAGNPITQKWDIKKHRTYRYEGAGA